MQTEMPLICYLCMFAYTFICVYVLSVYTTIAIISFLIFWRKVILTMRKSEFESFKPSVLDTLVFFLNFSLGKYIVIGLLRFCRNVPDLEDTFVFGSLSTQCHIYTTGGHAVMYIQMLYLHSLVSVDFCWSGDYEVYF